MSKFKFRKVAVLGAGVMGSQIAAHCANAQVPVIVFDLPDKKGPKNGIVDRAIHSLTKMKPAPLGAADLAQFIQAANYEEHLALLTECDLIIEAIAERLDLKHDLYKKISNYIGKNTIFATNTSGLPISTLSEGFDQALKKRFCGVHFFNPPRYMHLCELIPSPSTEQTVLDQLETFITSVLGKGVVYAKDTPNFVANRVGVAGMLAVMVEAEKYGLSFEVVDQLTGSKLGRAKSATFRTADVVGLDTMHHVIATMQKGLPQDPFASIYEPPAVLEELIKLGNLGQKTKAGFFKKDGKNILRFDLDQGDYVPADEQADKSILDLLKIPNAADRLAKLRQSEHPQGKFLWAIFRDIFHYVAVHLQEIADSAREVDLAMRWGFGWAHGPFEIWQSAGWQQIAQWVKEDIDNGLALCAEPLPSWVFAEPVVQDKGVYSKAGAFGPVSGKFEPQKTLPVYERQLFRQTLYGESGLDPKTAGKLVEENDAARIWTQPGHDDVLIISLKTKMHAISAAAIKSIRRAIDLAEQSYKGLVIWSPDAPFSVGADLHEMSAEFQKGGAELIEPMVAAFQHCSLALRNAQVPTVAAVSGMALGGGCEFAMHCSGRVAAWESYMGLVEVGVGLIPAGGGLKEIAMRAAANTKQFEANDLLAFIKKDMMTVATAKVSGSAYEAKKLGFLQPHDPIVMNSFELLHVALNYTRCLSESGYRPPMTPPLVNVAGKTGLATIQATLLNMREGGFISDYDYTLGRAVAEVLCGGQVEAGSSVDEAWLLKLERQFFMQLLANEKTQERVAGMLKTGKPVRN